MSVEDLEPADPPGNAKCLTLKGSQGQGLCSMLQKRNGILRGKSLPSLMDLTSYPNEEDDANRSEDAIDAIKQEQEETFIKVVVEQDS